jgi:hypothetical protein
MITKKRKPGHELVLKMQAKATINMTTTIFMKIDNLNDQSLSLFTMPLVVIKLIMQQVFALTMLGSKL